MNLRMDLRDVMIVMAPEADPCEVKAARVLVEEVRKRTDIEWELRTITTADHLAALEATRSKGLVLLGTLASLERFFEPLVAEVRAVHRIVPEGFTLLSKESPSPVVIVCGSDRRGVLYGVGALLRRLSMDKNSIALPESLMISSSPRLPVRGHQLGYRPLNNTYDAWTPEQFDQYIRELALFGANTIELVPPGADDVSAIAPHMKLPPLEMLVRCCQICQDYGLDVSLWYPNEGRDFESSRAVDRELEKRKEIFGALPRLNALFIPAGDPGRLAVDTFFVWAEKVANLVRKYHPRAKVGISSQGFRVTSEWLAGFYSRLGEEPPWLDFVVFAPWERDPLPVLRERVPSRYPIRHYPDITHTFLCQYPVPSWDIAFARTEGRECINPRPQAMKHIHNLTWPYTCGSVTYSEGVNDDVNKFVWTYQDWDPATPVETALADYARFFIGPAWAGDFVQAILALEKNWSGALARNVRVEDTLAMWLDLESRVPNHVRNNWRFQQGLLRACFDAYVRRRLLREHEAEEKAWTVLRNAVSSGAVEEAEAILAAASPENHVSRGPFPASPEPRDTAGFTTSDLRRRCFELADALWQNIGEQLTVERHHASSVYRGAFLDTIDAPLNNRGWLRKEFARIRSLRGEEDRLEAIRKLVRRSMCSQGEYHDNFLSPDAEAIQRVRPQPDWQSNPGFWRSTLVSYWPGPDLLAWQNTLWSHYDTPIRMRYDGLGKDPYLLRITYAPGPWGYQVKLHAGENQVIHDFIEVRGSCRVCEYDLSLSLTAAGTLELTWTTRDGELGPRIAEVCLLKKCAPK